MRKVNIVCDGGLGNRFGALHGGLFVNEKIQGQPVIWWPIKNNCACQFNDLFENNDFEIIEEHTDNLYNDYEKYYFLAHTTLIDQIPNSYLHKHNRKNLNSCINEERDIVYLNNSVEKYVTDDIFFENLKKLKIQKNILERVYDFCEDNNITTSVKGIHIRKTDGALRFDEDAVFDHIKNTGKRKFFVCSDDKATEDKFNQLKNVFVYPKQNYVEKLNPGAWRLQVIDSEGRNSKYNIMRSKESIIEGFIDMLILSRTNISVINKSSFLGFAKRYARIELFEDNNE